MQIELSAEDRGMLMVQAARMNAYKQLAQAEELELYRLVRNITGVDLASENWILDVESGTLEHVPNPQQ